MAYHLGLSCKAKDAVRALKSALANRWAISGPINNLALRTDNGAQFTANAFAKACEELGVTHERIPVNTPNMNAYIESFHAILENECYSQHEFVSFVDVYKSVSEYMQYYNEWRRHGSHGLQISKKVP